MASLDPRLAAALDDEPAAQSMLSELHRQITACRDPNGLASLLGRYVVVAAARQSLSTEPRRPAMRSAFPMMHGRAPLMESRRRESIARIAKAVQDAQNNLITNIR